MAKDASSLIFNKFTFDKIIFDIKQITALIFVPLLASNFINEFRRLVCCVLPKFFAVSVLNKRAWLCVVCTLPNKSTRLVCVCELNWDTARRETSCVCEIKEKLGWAKIFTKELLVVSLRDCEANTFNKLFKLYEGKFEVEHNETKVALDAAERYEDELNTEIRSDAEFEFNDLELARKVRSVCCVDKERVLLEEYWRRDASDANVEGESILFVAICMMRFVSTLLKFKFVEFKSKFNICWFVFELNVEAVVVEVKEIIDDELLLLNKFEEEEALLVVFGVVVVVVNDEKLSRYL